MTDMIGKGLLTVELIDELKATEMHGHMIDFKKRGGYIRNRIRRFFGRPAADFGMKPSPLPVSRVLVELVISTIFSWPALLFADGWWNRFPSELSVHFLIVFD
ncbi:MAG: hypothetical protein WDM76_00435 [Limisphaerales bacterium]